MKFSKKKSKLEKIKEKLFYRELILTIIFKELLYIVLPLLVIIFTFVFFKQFNPVAFFASSDLAFAVTVLNAVALSSFIEFKVRHQNPKSFTLIEGSKLYIFLLILSTLVLSFIILNEMSVLKANIDKNVFCVLNIWLFFISVFSISMKHAYLLKVKYGLKQKTNYFRFFRNFKNGLSKVNHDIEDLLLTSQNLDNKELEDDEMNSEMTDIYKTHETEKINILINQSKAKLEKLEEQIKSMK